MTLNPSQPHLLSSASKRWHGQLQIEFSRSLNQDGAAETAISRSQTQAPLKVQRPFYPEGSQVCHTVLLHTAGGIVGGDRLSLDIHLNPGALALITTAAAAKVYRSSGAEATQTVQIHLAADACLEWLPQEAIVFDGAIYRQDLQVDLAPGATWVGWDITRLGRTARGEKFLGGEWRSRTQVWQQGRPLWIDPQYLVGGSEMLVSPHGLAECPVIGSFALIGQTVSPELVTQIRSLFPPAAFPSGQAPSSRASSSQIGVTRLMSGLLCRYRGNSTAEARQWFTQAWNLLRPIYLGRSVCMPRVWQV
ncbi:MAG TPA: urease accessory protein UreD [Coleofasciculaceae cyanobacterium]